MFDERDRIRREVCAAFLRGQGAEIGAGANPHQLPAGASSRRYDIRSAAELQALFGTAAVGEVASIDGLWHDFAHGADFLIAHNVLEHAADPIGTLIGWHRAVRDGGTMVLSLPDKNACPDAARLEPPFAHLLDDYLLDRGAQAFESREHILSFGLCWPTDPGPGSRAHAFWRRLLAWPRGRNEVGAMSAPGEILATLFEPAVDIHWHAFTQSLAEKTVLAACELGGRSATLLAKADFTSTPVPTVGDIILVYQLQRGGSGCHGFTYEVADGLAAARTALRRALFRAGDQVHGADAPAAPAAALPRQSPHPAWIDRADRPAALELRPPFGRELGHCFRQCGLVTCSPPDTAEQPTASRFELLEDGVPLALAHSPHQDIRELGRGRYSHWYDAVYFATRDNSDPNRNGRRYRLQLRAG